MFLLSGKIMAYLTIDDSLDLVLCVLGFSVKCFSSCGSWLKELEADDLTHPFLVVFSTGSWMAGLLLSGDLCRIFEPPVLPPS